MLIPDLKRRTRADARRSRIVVAVIGSGEASGPDAADVGHLIATLGHDLLTGGGGGVMEAASRGFFETPARRGVVIGIIPAEVSEWRGLEARTATRAEITLRRGYPNVWVELAIYTHLPDSGTEGTLRSSRNHINVLSADAIVALPGGAGTESEIWLATRYRVPIVAFGAHEPAAPHGIPRAATLDELRDFLTSAVPRQDPPRQS